MKILFLPSKNAVFAKAQVFPINIITHLVKSHRVGGTPYRPTICCKNAKNRIGRYPHAVLLRLIRLYLR